MRHGLSGPARAAPQRRAVRAAAVPHRQRADADLRRHGHHQSGPRLAVHDRRLRGLSWSPGQWGSVWLALPVAVVGGIAARPRAGARPVPLFLHPRAPRPGAADLRADPAVRGRRARCWSATTSIPCRCPPLLDFSVPITAGFSYSAYRFAVIGICLALAGATVLVDRAHQDGRHHPRRRREARDGRRARHRCARRAHDGVRHRHGAGAGRGRAGGAALLRLSQHGRRLPHHLLRRGGDRRARLGLGRVLVRARHRARRHAGQGLRAEGGGSRRLCADGRRAALAAVRPVRQQRT